MAKHLILDANNLLFRARYAARRRPYENVIIHTFFRSIKPIVEKFSPDHVYFVLDGRPKKRLELNEEYKATRKYHNDDGFREQRRQIIDLVKESLPFIVIRHPETEADDVIADLSLNVISATDEKVIVSSDTDFIQLLQDCANIKLYNPVTKSYREAPEYSYVMWKSLRGDNADNIKGLPGIGDKRAAALATDPEKFRKFFQEKGETFLETYERNVKLIQLAGLTTSERPGVEVSYATNDMSTLRESFTELNFKSMISNNAWEKYSRPFMELSNVERIYT
tara:strand:- start:3843 stop:4682 length:840 start_codon:yes stop_codon:yes gene_type:complete